MQHEAVAPSSNYPNTDADFAAALARFDEEDAMSAKFDNDTPSMNFAGPNDSPVHPMFLDGDGNFYDDFYDDDDEDEEEDEEEDDDEDFEAEDEDDDEEGESF